MTNLDSGKAHQTRLLVLEPMEDGVRVVAVHVGFLHEWEAHTMVELAERRDSGVVTGFLTSELRIGI